MIIVHTICFSK